VDEAARAELEKEIRRRVEAGELDAAATAALRGYGPEIYGFLVAMHRDDEDAGDVFSQFSENLWKGLPKFGWQCTLRAWAYTIARNASYRFRKNARRRAAGQLALSDADAGAVVEKVAHQVRTETRSWLKTEQKDRFAALRESLPAEDQTLLILRVDRGLAWEELARVMLTEEEASDPREPSEEDLKKESARLRKRFQLVKEKLLEMGKRAGLIKPKPEE